MAHLLLVALNHQRPQILLQFSLIDAMFILYVFERYLRFFLELSELVLIIEDEMLDSLLVYLSLDLILLLEVLQLSLLVTVLGLFVFQLFLCNYPEVVNPLALVLVETAQVLFLFNLLGQKTAFLPNCLLVFIIIDIVNCVGLHFGFFLCGKLLWLWFLALVCLGHILI